MEKNGKSGLERDTQQITCNLRYGNLTFTFKTTKGKTYKVMVENEKLKKIPL